METFAHWRISEMHEKNQWIFGYQKYFYFKLDRFDIILNRLLDQPLARWSYRSTLGNLPVWDHQMASLSDSEN